MSRPDLRPMHRLPMLEAHRLSLETCVFCPKLCRSACPVSNVEASETLTPWGKMSSTYFLARGDVPASESFARPSLACTGCYACRALCDHKNDVTSTLMRARATAAGAGILPEVATRVGSGFIGLEARTREAIEDLSRHRAVRSDSANALLIGCTYARRAKTEGMHAIDAASGLLRGPVALVKHCCGLPLLYAGDTVGFARQARRVAQSLDRVERVVVVDPGCAMTLRQHYVDVATLRPAVDLLVDLAADDLARFTPAPIAGPVRYHDPCQLGRGLGVYEAPRRVLGRALGRSAEEFPAQGEAAVCSGAGGLLPVTMPDTARAIADSRLDEHRRSGGGEVVTACASSLLAFRRASARLASPAPVSDLVTWIARALPRVRP